MAEFCKQCADELGFECDFVGRNEGHQFLDVLCEGCGPAVVTDDGVCHSKTCLFKHGEKKP